MRIEEPSLRWLSDPECFAVNRIEAHSDHFYFQKKDEENLKEKMPLRQDLNGSWYFSYADNPSGRKADFYKSDVDCKNFERIEVPGHIQLQGYDHCHYVNTMYPWDGIEELRPPQVSEAYNPVGSYVRYFETGKELEGKRTFLSFQGVETAFYVWLNGSFVGYSEDSFTPAEFEVTEFLAVGENKLAVEVYKRSSASWLEDQDFWRFSGIFRDVYLYGIPSVHAADVRIISTLQDGYQNGAFEAILKLTGETKGTVVLELLDPQGNISLNMEAAAHENVQLKGVVPKVQAWSAESPCLYLARFLIYDENKELVELVPYPVGFRSFELLDGIMCLNGKRILFKGVNRHDFNMERGRSVTKEDMLWDIRFMKRYNINAVRTSHYPNNSLWYRLCDEYGIYLIDETNLESHGSWQKLGACEPSWNVPGNQPEWEAAVVDRARSMYERDKNHPSVLIWSCGNESYAGTGLAAMSDFFHHSDSTRLVHYEGVFWNREFDWISDMESRMYAKPEEVEEYLENSPKKPYISCEYMHAMGNSCGGLKLYTDLEDRYPLYQGGFIWDFIDQSILCRNDQGEEIMAYGGDFDDRPSDYEFCGNGIVFADRTVTPKAEEVKKLYSNVKILPDENGVTLRNGNCFVSLGDYDFCCRIMRDGVPVFEAWGEAEVHPGEQAYLEYKKMDIRNKKKDETKESADFYQTFEEFKEKEGKKFFEYIYEVTMHLKNSNAWAEKGYELAFGQYVRKVQEKKIGLVSEKLCIIHGDVNLGVAGKDFRIQFSRAEGGIASLIYDGEEMITRTPRVSYWRACTDNDRGVKHGFDRGQWLQAGMFQKLIHVSEEEKDNEVTIRFEYQLPMGNQACHFVTYRVTSDGAIHVKAEYPGYEELPEIPVFGMDFRIKERYHNVSYYGYGPHENYVDRMEGSRLGIFKTTAQENLTPYLVPQECGNRGGMRWLQVSDDQGKGLCFVSERDPFEGSVLPYSSMELESALHPQELPGVHYTWVRILARQMGVGGDDSFGACVHSQYRIPGKTQMTVEFALCRRLPDCDGRK